MTSRTVRESICVALSHKVGSNLLQRPQEAKDRNTRSWVQISVLPLPNGWTLACGLTSLHFYFLVHGMGILWKVSRKDSVRT